MYTYTDGKAQDVQMDMGNPQRHTTKYHTPTETQQVQRHNSHTSTETHTATQAQRHRVAGTMYQQYQYL